MAVRTENIFDISGGHSVDMADLSYLSPFGGSGGSLFASTDTKGLFDGASLTGAEPKIKADISRDAPDIFANAEMGAARRGTEVTELAGTTVEYGVDRMQQLANFGFQAGVAGTMYGFANASFYGNDREETPNIFTTYDPDYALNADYPAIGQVQLPKYLQEAREVGQDMFANLALVTEMHEMTQAKMQGIEVGDVSMSLSTPLTELAQKHQSAQGVAV